MVVGAVIYFML